MVNNNTHNNLNNNHLGFGFASTKRDNLVYFALLVMGYCFGLSWSVITNSGKIFEEKLSGTKYAQTFLTQFAVVYQAISFLFILASVRLSTFVSEHLQIIISAPALAFLMICFGITCSIDYSNKFLFYVLTLILSVFVSFFSALFRSGSFLVAGCLPSNYINALYIGEGVSSVIMAAYSLIIACFFNPKGQTLTFINFGMALLIISKSLFLYLMMRRRPIFSLNKDEIQKDSANSTSIKSMISQMKLISREIFTLMISCSVSLFIFPFMVVCTEASIENLFYRERVFRYLTFLLYASGDLLGKSLPAFIDFAPYSKKYLMKMVIGRILFIPLFFLGNFKLKGQQLLPNLLGYDLIFFFLIFVSAISGGFTSTMACLIAPKKFSSEDRGQINTIMSAFASLGNLCGSVFASLFAYILN